MLSSNLTMLKVLLSAYCRSTREWRGWSTPHWRGRGLVMTLLITRTSQWRAPDLSQGPRWSSRTLQVLEHLTSATLANIPARKSYRVTTHRYIIGNILRALEQPKVGLDNDQTKLNVTFGHLVTTHLHWVFHLIRSKWPHWFDIFWWDNFLFLSCRRGHWEECDEQLARRVLAAAGARGVSHLRLQGHVRHCRGRPRLQADRGHRDLPPAPGEAGHQPGHCPALLLRPEVVTSQDDISCRQVQSWWMVHGYSDQL